MGNLKSIIITALVTSIFTVIGSQYLYNLQKPDRENEPISTHLRTKEIDFESEVVKRALRLYLIANTEDSAKLINPSVKNSYGMIGSYIRELSRFYSSEEMHKKFWENLLFTLNRDQKDIEGIDKEDHQEIELVISNMEILAKKSHPKEKENYFGDNGVTVKDWEKYYASFLKLDETKGHSGLIKKGSKVSWTTGSKVVESDNIGMGTSDVPVKVYELDSNMLEFVKSNEIPHAVASGGDLKEDFGLSTVAGSGKIKRKKKAVMFPDFSERIKSVFKSSGMAAHASDDSLQKKDLTPLEKKKIDQCLKESKRYQIKKCLEKELKTVKRSRRRNFN